jgi:hypothetical protein
MRVMSQKILEGTKAQLVARFPALRIDAMLFPSSPARGASSPGDGGGVFVPPELESMLQTTSPKTAKHVLSRAACDALAEVRRRRRVARILSFVRSFIKFHSAFTRRRSHPRSTPRPTPPLLARS